MSLVVKCDYCQKEVTDYHKMYSYEDNVMVSTSPLYACFECTHAYRLGVIKENLPEEYLEKLRECELKIDEQNAEIEDLKSNTGWNR